MELPPDVRYTASTSSGLAVFFRASPYGLAAYPGLCRGFFSSRGAEKMAASAVPILGRHRPSAAESLQQMAARCGGSFGSWRAPARLPLGPPSTSSGLAVFIRASPYGLMAYPGLCRGFFSSRGAEKMAASAVPIVCCHLPSAGVSFNLKNVVELENPPDRLLLSIFSCLFWPPIWCPENADVVQLQGARCAGMAHAILSFVQRSR